MVNKLIKVEHVWCEEEDRWIYIERYANTEYIGLNFSQGVDKEFFNDHFCEVDQGLSNFFEVTTDHDKGNKDEISVINKYMWLYHAAVIAYEDVQTKELYLKRKNKEQN